MWRKAVPVLVATAAALAIAADGAAFARYMLWRIELHRTGEAELTPHERAIADLGAWLNQFARP